MRLDEERLLWIARMIGLAGMGLLVFSGVGGVVMSSKYAAKFSRRFPRWSGAKLFANHRLVSLIGAGLFLLHPIPMLFAPRTTGGLNLTNVLVPFTASRQTLYTGLGTLAFYTLLVVVVSSLLYGRMKWGNWRILHYGTYLFFALGLAHSLLISAEYRHEAELIDFEEPEKAILAGMGGLVLAFVAWRIYAARQAKARKQAKKQLREGETE